MSERISLTAPDGVAFDAYIARPEGTPRGGLVVIQEIWGLVPHIESIADRWAAEGYVAIAPDLLSNVGVTPDIGLELFAIMTSRDEEVRLAGQPRLREAFAGVRAPEYAKWAVGALKSAVDWLAAAPGVDGRIGVTGYCFGGTYSFELAAADDRIRAAAPFYGTAPSEEAIRRIRVPILAQYGHHDPALIDALPTVREQMAAAGVDFEAIVYPDAGQDSATTPDRTTARMMPPTHGSGSPRSSRSTSEPEALWVAHRAGSVRAGSLGATPGELTAHPHNRCRLPPLV